MARTKADAVIDLINEARKITGSRSRMGKALRACKTLGLDGEDTARVMMWLEYWNEHSEPLPAYR